MNSAPEIAPNHKIVSLKDFYDLMGATCLIRRKLVLDCLSDTDVEENLLDSLRNSLIALQSLSDSGKGAVLKLDKNKDISIDLSYEIRELQKDLLFLTEGEDSFYEFLNQKHDNFSQQVKSGVDLLSSVNLQNFISDRDGTVNNYCGRYLSSIQSVYNALFLTRFARKSIKNGIILTSAPLEQGGMLDIITSPTDSFIYAGSKGREYRNTSNKRGTYAIPDTQQGKIDELNAKLADLVKEPSCQMYALIGSGLQFKFGQTTIARQDITKSIPEQESLDFLTRIENIVANIDPSKEFFRIEDTGLDIEIILTLDDSSGDGALKDFDKGDGVLFLDRELDLHISDGPNLVCGDTNSDVPMVKACADLTDNTWTIFVTKDNRLKDKVLTACSKGLIVSEPDILVTILNELAK